MNIDVGYEYDEKYDKKKVEELRELIKGIQPNKDVMDYFLHVMSSALTGYHIQKIVILTGGGGNGKGLLMKLLSATLGNYYYVLPNSVLTKSIDNNGGANQEIALMSGKRLVNTSEPKKGTKLCMDTVKVITGENVLNARGIYSQETRVFMNSLLVLQANDIPPYDETGEAVNRRAIVIPFKTTAVSKKKYEEKEDKTNYTIENTYYDTDEWRNDYKLAYFHLLLEYMSKFYENETSLLEMTKECQEATDKQFSMSDTIISAIEEEYVEDEQNYEVIPIKVLYNAFKITYVFLDLSKEEKRRYNYKYYCDTIRKNRLLEKYVVEENQRYKSKGKLITGVSLCGWRKKDEDGEPAQEPAVEYVEV
jgi:phage/plasmid-associated DNA primase